MNIFHSSRNFYDWNYNMNNKPKLYRRTEGYGGCWAAPVFIDKIDRRIYLMDRVNENDELYSYPSRSSAVKYGGQVSKLGGRMMIHY